MASRLVDDVETHLAAHGYCEEREEEVWSPHPPVCPLPCLVVSARGAQFIVIQLLVIRFCFTVFCVLCVYVVLLHCENM